MSVPEIRECLAGDALHREIAGLRNELLVRRKREAVDYELSQEVNEHQLLRITTPEAFSNHAEKLFLKCIGQKSCLRLTGTPLPLGIVDLRENREQVKNLVCNPPKYRSGGFDVGATNASGVLRGWGIERKNHEYNHLRLFWNGHVEHWNADPFRLSWHEPCNPPFRAKMFRSPSLSPLSIIESTASFILLLKESAHVVGYRGIVEFRFNLYNVRDMRIYPGASGTTDRFRYAPHLGQQDDIGVLHEDHVRISPVKEGIEKPTRYSCISIDS